MRWIFLACALASCSVATPFEPSQTVAWKKLRPGTLICTVERKSLCSDGVCKPAQLSTWVFVDLDELNYGVCDSDRCTREDFRPDNLPESDGSIMRKDYIHSTRFGWTASFGPDGKFDEVKTQGGDVVVSSGTCRPKP